MFFNLFLLNYVMKLSNYFCVLVYILQTLGILMEMRCRIHHMIQVSILMISTRRWLMHQMIEMILMRLMVHQYRLLLGVIDHRLDTEWIWAANSVD